MVPYGHEGEIMNTASWEMAQRMTASVRFRLLPMLLHGRPSRQEAVTAWQPSQMVPYGHGDSMVMARIGDRTTTERHSPVRLTFGTKTMPWLYLLLLDN